MANTFHEALQASVAAAQQTQRRLHAVDRPADRRAGLCVQCGAPVAEHFGRRNQFVACADRVLRRCG